MKNIPDSVVYGILLFACGGAIVLYSIYNILNTSISGPIVLADGFLSFLVLGFGLWLIVRQNKSS
jgi:hypothetical protein